MDLTESEDRVEGEGQVQASHSVDICLSFFSKVEIAIGNHGMQITKLERK